MNNIKIGSKLIEDSKTEFKRKLSENKNNSLLRGIKENDKKMIDQLIMPSGISDNFLTSTRKLYRICLTGGPCSGKRSALQHIKTRMDQLNTYTIIVPQAMNILENGFLVSEIFEDPKMNNEFQLNILKTQLVLENIFTDMAYELIMSKNFSQDILIVCDSGCMSVSA